MAVAFDAANVGSTAGGTTINVSLTPSGADRVLYVFVVQRSSDVCTGVTFNSVALSEIQDLPWTDSAIGHISLWRLINPDAVTANATASFSTGRRAVAHAISFNGAHQTTPNGTPVTATNNGASATHPSCVVSSATDEIVLDCAGLQNDDNTSTLTVGASQDQRGNNATSNGTSSGIRGASSTEPGASSVTMSWTSDATDDWGQIAIAVKPSASAPQSKNLLLMGVG